jgi:hypothetical protein
MMVLLADCCCSIMRVLQEMFGELWMIGDALVRKFARCGAQAQTLRVKLWNTLRVLLWEPAWFCRTIVIHDGLLKWPAWNWKL